MKLLTFCLVKIQSLDIVPFPFQFQTWSDLKKRIKKKAGYLAKATRKTGNVKAIDDKGREVPPLTAEEQQIVDLCGGKEWVGQPEEEEIGLPQQEVS